MHGHYSLRHTMASNVAAAFIVQVQCCLVGEFLLGEGTHKTNHDLFFGVGVYFVSVFPVAGVSDKSFLLSGDLASMAFIIIHSY